MTTLIDLGEVIGRIRQTPDFEEGTEPDYAELTLFTGSAEGGAHIVLIEGRENLLLLRDAISDALESSPQDVV